MTTRARATPVAVADGIWRLTLGMPLKINVFLIREDDGVAIFDAASKPLGPKIRQAADALGGATRVIIGNAHPDHRGGARSIGAPVQCHVDERADMESDGGWHYFDFDALPWFARGLTKRVMRSFDDGALHVAKTLEEGDRVGDFEVIHLPGHAPGCIGLWRASDRLALSNDCFALFDPRCRGRQAADPASGLQLVDRARPRVDREARRAGAAHLLAGPLRPADRRRRRAAARDRLTFSHPPPGADPHRRESRCERRREPMTSTDLLLAEEFLLLVLDDEKGHDKTMAADTPLAGALLLDLAVGGWVEDATASSSRPRRRPPGRRRPQVLADALAIIQAPTSRATRVTG